jgi:predicted amidohydrolase
MAAAQTVPVACDVAANARQHLQLVEAAALEGVTLLVFPELSLTGYELAAAPALAFEAEDVRLRPLLAAAKEHGMTLVVGAPVRSESGLHIAAFVIEPAGTVQLYTKHHLGAFRPDDNPGGSVPPAEATFFTPGVANPIVTWCDQRLALSICADSTHPAHPQRAAELGAVLYASCQFAIPLHMAFKMARLKEAARRHALTVIFANYGGVSGGLSSGGGSCIRAPDGTAVVRLPAQGSGLAIAWQDEAGWSGKSVLVGAVP